MPLERSRRWSARRFCWMARSSASSKSAAKAQIRTAPARTLLLKTSETSWLSASRSAKCSVTWRANDPCVPRLSSRVHKSLSLLVLRENSTKEAHRLIAASIGLALPSDKSMYGYLSEHHSFGETEEVAGEYAEELAAEMLATTLNVEFDPDLSFDEKKEVYRISNKIVRTMNVTQSAVGDKRGLWTTVLGAAILIGEDD